MVVGVQGGDGSAADRVIAAVRSWCRRFMDRATCCRQCWVKGLDCMGWCGSAAANRTGRPVCENCSTWLGGSPGSAHHPVSCLPLDHETAADCARWRRDHGGGR